MSTQTDQRGAPANRSMPPGTIIPELAYDDMAAAVAWLCAAFGFKERLRIGGHRTQLVFGGASVIVIAGPAGATAPARHSLLVVVDDADQHHADAVRHGAVIISPPADYPFGERQYTAEDPSGRRWTFTQSIADIDPRSWGGAPVE